MEILDRIRKSQEFWTLAHLASLTYIVSLIMFTALFLVAPFLINLSIGPILGFSAVLYNSVSVFQMCHQLPERSFFILGVQFPICARCIGIYLGGSLGGMLAILRGRPKFLSTKILIALFLVLTLPMALDGVTQTLLFERESTNSLRLLTGLLFGFGVIYLIPMLVFEKFRRFNADKKDLDKLAYGVNLAILVLILLSGIYVGNSYLSQEDALNIAISKTGLNPSQAIVYYIPPNAVKNVKNDPYLETYSDVILGDLSRISFEESRYGLWAIAFLDEKPESSGKYAYFSRAKGTYVYIDAWTGRDVRKISH